MSLLPRGAYIDEKGVRWDTNHADLEGYLYKRSKWISQWRKRYFILKGSKLFFARRPTAPPHGMIDLVDSRSVTEISESITRKHFSFLISLREEEYFLYAEGELILKNWLNFIGKYVFICLRNFLTYLDIYLFVCFVLTIRSILKHSSVYLDERPERTFHEDPLESLDKTATDTS
jgi:hypothetical protein